MRISDWSSDGCSSDLLGIEVDTGQEVEAAEARLSAEGMSTTGVDDTTCCYAFKTETGVNDPDGASWEVYVKTGAEEQMAANADREAAAGQRSEELRGERERVGTSRSGRQPITK